ncbi:MAG: cation:proton antiporter [Burkholderiaceae bacterium]
MQVTLAAVVVLGVLSHWLAWRLKLPAILFLLIIGIFVGPIAGLVDPDALFGDALFSLVSLSVAIILFEGSLTLRGAELREIGAAVWGLVTIGALITGVGVAFAAHHVMLLQWPVAAMVGAICTVTGPTVVVPMLRAIRPTVAVSRTLRWEGIVIDPIGAMLAVLVFEFVQSHEWFAALQVIAWLVVCGLAFGVVCAFVLGALLRHHLVPWYLRSVVALAFVFVAFAGANSLAHESGLLAVTVMGVMLANMRGINVDDILDFKESLTLLLVAVLFITLAARLDLTAYSAANWRLAVFLALVILVIRPLAVFMATAFSKLSLAEKLLVSWISPRGIVAAVVAALFALQLQQLGVADADQLVPLVFAVIIATVVLQSATAVPIARRLGLSMPVARGVIILGAATPNRLLARKLADRGFDVLVADTDWTDVRKARMEGLNAYFGRIVSDHAEGVIETGNIGCLLGMSNRRDKNLIACLHFRPELGADNVFVLDVHEPGGSRSHELVGNLQVPTLFGEGYHFGDWERAFEEGGEIRVTRMTEAFGFREFRDSVPGEFRPLLGIDPKGRLVPFTDRSRPTIRAGWTLLTLIPGETLRAERAHPVDIAGKAQGGGASAVEGGGADAAARVAGRTGPSSASNPPGGPPCAADPPGGPPWG